MSELSAFDTHTNIIDLPDDCILVFVKWLTIIDIVRLRMSCKRMSYATRLRSVWYRIYQRFSRLVPMLPLPHPYSVDALDSVPSHVLEHLCIFAYRCHQHFTKPLPSPCSARSLSASSSSPEDLHILCGGRWFVQVFSEDWSVSVRDLMDGKERKMASVSMSDELLPSPVTSAVVKLGDRLHILLHGVRLESSFLLSYKTIDYVLTLKLPVERSQDNSSVENAHPLEHSIALLPSLAGLSGMTSRIDANGKFMSFYVLEEEDLYVLDWTYHVERTRGEISAPEVTVKGVVLCSSLLSEFPSDTLTWTRVLSAKDHNYLAVIADGVVLLFLIPPVTVAQPTKLPHIQVAPIARVAVPSVPIESVSAWSTGISTGDSRNEAYNLALSTPMSVYTVTFIPSRVSAASSRNSYDVSTMCPSTLTLTRTHLPITLDKRVALCAFGPSGTRGVYVEHSRYLPRYSELIIYAGPLLATSKFSGPPSGTFLGDTEDLEKDTTTELFNPTVSRRVVLPGVSSSLKQSINKIAFDECSGRVCFRRADGSITLMDFSPLDAEL